MCLTISCPVGQLMGNVAEYPSFSELVIMRMARLELARQSHTPLKRARIPIPPHPRIADYSKKKGILLKIFFSGITAPLKELKNINVGVRLTSRLGMDEGFVKKSEYRSVRVYG